MEAWATAVAKQQHQISISSSVPPLVLGIATELLVLASRLPALFLLELTFFPGPAIALVEHLIGAIPRSKDGALARQLQLQVFNLCGLEVLPLLASGTDTKLQHLAAAFRGAVNCSNPVRQSPLHVASELARAGSCSTLLAWGAAVDAKDKSGATPLFVACEQGHAGIAAMLLEAGAHPTCSNAAGESPLYIACLRGHLCVVQVLLRHLHSSGIPWVVRLLYPPWPPNAPIRPLRDNKLMRVGFLYDSEAWFVMARTTTFAGRRWVYRWLDAAHGRNCWGSFLCCSETDSRGR